MPVVQKSVGRADRGGFAENESISRQLLPIKPCCRDNYIIITERTCFGPPSVFSFLFLLLYTILIFLVQGHYVIVVICYYIIYMRMYLYVCMKRQSIGAKRFFNLFIYFLYLRTHVINVSPVSLPSCIIKIKNNLILMYLSTTAVGGLALQTSCFKNICEIRKNYVIICF